MMREFEDWDELHEAEEETVYISTNQVIEDSSEITYHASPQCGGIRDRARESLSKLEAEQYDYDPCGSCYPET